MLSFCLDRAFQVEVVEEGDLCSIRISPPDGRAGRPRLFEADTFEEALLAAADAGLVRKECIERQIVFCKSFGDRAFDPRHGQAISPAVPTTSEAVPAGPPHRRKPAVAHYRGLAELRYQIRKFVGFSERAARQAGLEPAQHQLLLAIKGLPSAKQPTVAVLAERMCLELGACETLIESVIERGLVRRITATGGESGMLVSLTETGEAVLGGLTVQHRNQMLGVGPTFVQVLGAILSSVDDEE